MFTVDGYFPPLFLRMNKSDLFECNKNLRSRLEDEISDLEITILNHLLKVAEKK